MGAIADGHGTRPTSRDCSKINIKLKNPFAAWAVQPSCMRTGVEWTREFASVACKFLARVQKTPLNEGCLYLTCSAPGCSTRCKRSSHQLRLLAAFPDASGTLLAWNNTALYVGILVGSALGAQIMSVASFSVLAWVLWAAAATGSLVSTRALPRAVRAVTVPEGS